MCPRYGPPHRSAPRRYTSAWGWTVEGHRSGRVQTPARPVERQCIRAAAVDRRAHPALAWEVRRPSWIRRNAPGRTACSPEGKVADTLVSVNVGMPRDVAWRGRTVHTGIWESPVP